jgi:hypothetical protein
MLAGKARGLRRALRPGMRKTNKIPSKKLNLNTQTVRELDVDTLDGVVGGYVFRSLPASCGGSCIRCPF